MSEINVIIENRNGINVVSSRVVAEQLGKAHRHVLAKIREIFTEPESWLSEYKDASGKSNQEYLLTKDDFILLCMNYQGYNDFKRAYIKKFNEMEKEIKSNNTKSSISPNLKEKEVEAKLNNSRVRMAQTWLKIGTLTGIQEYKEIANTYAANTLANKDILQLPKAQRKTYSATDIGKMFGVSANTIGKTANANNLKTPEYGQLFYDKSRHSCKEVETWRYYDNVIPVFEKFLKMGVSA